MRPWPPGFLAKFDRGIPPALANELPGRRYFLVCTNPAYPRWWCPLFKDGFRHCYVLIWDGAVWLYLDPTAERLHVSILDWYDPAHPATWIEDPNASVIEIPVGPPTGRSRAPWVIGSLACTEFCKALLGVRSFFLWTPWRLMRQLEKRHGRRCKKAKGNGGRQST